MLESIYFNTCIVSCTTSISILRRKSQIFGRAFDGKKTTLSKLDRNLRDISHILLQKSLHTSLHYIDVDR